MEYQKSQSTHEHTLKIDHKCSYPFNSSSIITILIFQDKGINKYRLGEKRCPWHIAKEIEETIYHFTKILREKTFAKFQTSTGSNLVSRKTESRALSTLIK